MTTNELTVASVLDAWAAATRDGRPGDALRSHEVGDDVAFAHTLFQCGRALPSGTTFSDTATATFCLSKHDTEWRIAHQHNSKPFTPR